MSFNDRIRTSTSQERLGPSISDYSADVQPTPRTPHAILHPWWPGTTEKYRSRTLFSACLRLGHPPHGAAAGKETRRARFPHVVQGHIGTFYRMWSRSRTSASEVSVSIQASLLLRIFDAACDSIERIFPGTTTTEARISHIDEVFVLATTVFMNFLCMSCAFCELDLLPPSFLWLAGLVGDCNGTRRNRIPRESTSASLDIRITCAQFLRSTLRFFNISLMRVGAPQHAACNIRFFCF
ncbi:hypothetical protein LshimejAT787_0701530 [Lyophyllum shimeji]|uniref:Uncharacterized protein n=1 Tax=Lyophyllum shimeji TaxID=47721 RepID=A0A9P3PPF2_LYOSH|nr:hypothetical protein LshimejAT787_0701530 [Lyophyllum shimeji]